MKLSNAQKVFCGEVSENTNVDIMYILENEDIKDIDGLYEYVEEENLTDEEVIYYSNAIKYLSENDASLNESIEIALEMGYELADINSELLATLLTSKNNREAWEEYREEIEEKIFQ